MCIMHRGTIIPVKYGRDASLARHAEADSLGEMIELGVRLADADLGDYWDDFDAIACNQLVNSNSASLLFCARSLRERRYPGVCAVSLKHRRQPGHRP